MRFLLTLTCAAVASGAVARKIQTVGWDKYAGERGFSGHDDPMEHATVHAREADPEVTQAWEYAHGGKAPIYKSHTEHEYGHFVPRSEHHDMHVPDFEEEDVDTSLEGYGVEQDHFAHLARSIPEFDEEDVDTSLEGYGEEYSGLDARSVPDFDEDDVDTSLEGYGDFDLHARSVPEFDEDDVDTSLEGYGLDARSEDDWEEEASEWHHSATPTPHHRTAWTEPTAWTKPTHVARAIKDAWDHYSGKASEAVEYAKPSAGMRHYARDAKGKLVYSHEPVYDEDFHGDPGARHHVRDAEAYAHGMHHGENPSPHEGSFHYARDAEAHNPYDYTHQEHHEGNLHHARDAEARKPYNYGSHEPVSILHRPHQARDAEPASMQHIAHPTASRTWTEEHESWTKHTATKTAHPSKTTGGWGIPW